MSRTRARRRSTRRRRRAPAAGSRRVLAVALTAVVVAAAGIVLLFWIARPSPHQPFHFPSAIGTTPTPARESADRSAGDPAA